MEDAAVSQTPSAAAGSAAAAQAEPADLKLITGIPAKVYSYCRDNKAQRIS